MANRNYATDYVIHAHGPGACSNPRKRDRVASEVCSDVTCKRCLASLAKRDRAFQRKARQGLTAPRRPRFSPESALGREEQEILRAQGRAIYRARAGADAARAIAAEEGRHV